MYFLSGSVFGNWRFFLFAEEHQEEEEEEEEEHQLVNIYSYSIFDHCL